MDYGSSGTRLITDIRASENLPTIIKKNKKKKKKILEGWVGFSRTFLSIIGIATSFLGPVGQFAGAAIELGGNLLLSAISGQKTDLLSTGVDVASFVGSLRGLSQASKLIDKKIFNFETVLDQVNTAVKKTSFHSTNLLSTKGSDFFKSTFKRFNKQQEILNNPLFKNTKQGLQQADFQKDIDEVIKFAFGKNDVTDEFIKAFSFDTINEVKGKILTRVIGDSFSKGNKKEWKKLFDAASIDDEWIYKGAFKEQFIQQVDERMQQLTTIINKFKKLNWFQKATSGRALKSIKTNLTRDDSMLLELFLNPKRIIKNRLFKNLKDGFFPQNKLWVRKTLLKNFSQQEREITVAIFNKLIYQKNSLSETRDLIQILEKELSPQKMKQLAELIKRNPNYKMFKNIFNFESGKRLSASKYKQTQSEFFSLFKDTSTALNSSLKVNKKFSKEWWFKMIGSDEVFNDRIIQGGSSLFSASDAGRNLAEKGAKWARDWLEKKFKKNKLFRNNVKTILKKGSELEKKIKATQKIFQDSGGTLIFSSYLLGFKILKDQSYKQSFLTRETLKGQYKKMCLMHFHFLTTDVKKGKNKGGKPPHIFYATQDELDLLVQKGSEYWFEVGLQKGWFKSRGGRTATTISPNFRSITYFLNYFPINAWRRGLGLVSNIVEGVLGGNPTSFNLLTNKISQEKFFDALIRTSVSRISRIGFVYGGGYLLKKRALKKLIKNEKLTKFNKKVFSKAAHYTQKQKNRMLRRASQEVIMKRRYMRKASSLLTSSLKLKLINKNGRYELNSSFDAKRKVESSFDKGFKRYAKTLFLDNALKNIIPQSIRSETLRKTRRKGLYGYSSFNSTRIKSRQLKRGWSSFTPSEFGNEVLKKFKF